MMPSNVTFWLFLVFLGSSLTFKIVNLSSRATIFHELVTLAKDKRKGDAGEVSKKGFGPPPEKIAEPEKDLGTLTYEKQASRGVPEYNIFLRPVNGTEEEWVPVGSMTIPRDTKVSKAVFEVESELLKGTFKLYPKLKSFYDRKIEKEQETVFEYGYCLKAYPDEPIKVIVKDAGKEAGGNFFVNWLGKITNPIDTTAVKNQGSVNLKQ